MRRCIIHFNLYATVAYPDMQRWHKVNDTPSQQGPEGPCGRRLVLVPHIGRTTPASRRPHPQRTLHKDRKGGDLFLFTHLTERCASWGT